MRAQLSLAGGQEVPVLSLVQAPVSVSDPLRRFLGWRRLAQAQSIWNSRWSSLQKTVLLATEE